MREDDLTTPVLLEYFPVNLSEYFAISDLFKKIQKNNKNSEHTKNTFCLATTLINIFINVIEYFQTQIIIFFNLKIYYGSFTARGQNPSILEIHLTAFETRKF